MQHINDHEHSQTAHRPILTLPPKPDFLERFSQSEGVSAIKAVAVCLAAVGLTRQQFLDLPDEALEKLASRYELTQTELMLAWCCWFRVIPLFERSSDFEGFAPAHFSSLSALVRHDQSGVTATPAP